MNWTTIYGFLTLTFIVHLIAFVIRYGRTKARVDILLCGTFVSLTALFYLKYRGLDWPVGLLSVQVLLRLLSGGCTLMALYLGVKKIRRDADEVGAVVTPYERRERRRGRRRSRRHR